MTYSFVKPKIKPVFSLFLRIWMVFFFFGAGFIVFIYLFIYIKTSFILSNIEQKKQELITIQNSIDENEKLFVLLSDQKGLALSINGKEGDNEKLRYDIANLFDLIVKTNGIKLDELNINRHYLRLSGITPTKEMFSLLIETPLKSVFDESKTSFYRLKNGWYRFVSVNEETIRLDNER
ncbi:hypothetical protein [Campylobacter sp. CCS1377]|uniref:Sensor histidine kinase n=1 Tax=Campylobacter sp. CCS1377 TaxID=3158229 RepID=A0AAU7EA51_9BACT